jgi:S-(hydroxymethyl)glutathione dehydrogenase/alcohol dehydrogenase
MQVAKVEAGSTCVVFGAGLVGLGAVAGCRLQGAERIGPRLLITGRRAAGASFGGLKRREQVPRLVERRLAGDLDVDPFISHLIGLDEVNHGFELMER